MTANPIEDTNTRATAKQDMEIMPHPGCFYREFLKHLHVTLQPASYLEIGTNDGGSLALAQCSSVAVDPNFCIEGDTIGRKLSCHFFRMKSDEFFRSGAMERIFPQGVDFTFLDGMHWFEFLLRDFINAERHCRRNSIIVMHDCLPPGSEMTERIPQPTSRQLKEYANYWTGDVWKIGPVLRKMRPDLKLVALDCPPTGLLICTNLNPNSPLLSERYFDLVAEYGQIDIADYGLRRLFEESNVQASRSLMDASSLSRMFWL